MYDDYGNLIPNKSEFFINNQKIKKKDIQNKYNVNLEIKKRNMIKSYEIKINYKKLIFYVDNLFIK